MVEEESSYRNVKEEETFVVSCNYNTMTKVIPKILEKNMNII